MRKATKHHRLRHPARGLLSIAVACVAALVATSARADGVVDLPVAGGVERVLYLAPARPTALLDLVTVSGGLPAKSGPCEAMAEHGFYGVESDAVRQIAGWIKSH